MLGLGFQSQPAQPSWQLEYLTDNHLMLSFSKFCFCVCHLFSVTARAEWMGDRRK